MPRGQQGTVRYNVSFISAVAISCGVIVDNREVRCPGCRTCTSGGTLLARRQIPYMLRPWGSHGPIEGVAAARRYERQKCLQTCLPPTAVRDLVGVPGPPRGRYRDPKPASSPRSTLYSKVEIDRIRGISTIHHSSNRFLESNMNATPFGSSILSLYIGVSAGALG